MKPRVILCGIEQFQDDAVKKAGLQELPKPQVLNCRNGRSRTVAHTSRTAGRALK